MQDDEASSGPAQALVATTLLTAVVGVGAVLYNRSTTNVHLNLRVGEMLGALGLSASGSGSGRGEPVPTDAVPGLVPVAAVAEETAKNARSKERRRRGKDPLKEVLKGGKKAKARLERVLATTTLKDEPDDADRTPSEYATTSRSVSTASSSRWVSECTPDDDDDQPTPPDALSVSDSIPSLVDSASTTSASSVATLPSDSEEPDPPTVQVTPDCFPDAMAMSLRPPSPKQKAAPARRRNAPRYPSPSRVALGIPPSSPRASRAPSSSHPSSTHSSRPSTPPLQTQLASLRGALEAARTREETARRDMERYGKEMEMMRWERDALRAQVFQMQAYLGTLLSSPPPFTPYAMSPGPGSPGQSPMPNGWYPPMHMQVPYSGSATASPGGSPASRGRRRTRPDLEDEQVSEVLADAILKRPGSMLGSRPTSIYSTSPAPPPMPEEAQEVVLEELTFPSLYPMPARS